MAVFADASTPASGDEAVYNLKTFLKAHNRTVRNSGDGLSAYGASSDVIVSAASGAGGLGNAGAWFVLQEPSGSREWLFVRGADAQTWTVRRGKGFTAGSPNAVTPPTDSTSEPIFNNAQMFPGTIGNWYLDCDDASPHGWFARNVPTGGGNVQCFLCDEPLRSGTYDAGDTDPYLCGGGYNGSGAAPGQFKPEVSTGWFNFWKRYDHGGGGATNRRIGFLQLYSEGNILAPAVNNAGGQVGADPETGREWMPFIGVTRPGASTATNGFCGETSRLRWSTVWSTALGRPNGGTARNAGPTAYWMYTAGIYTPWDSTTPTP